MAPASNFGPGAQNLNRAPYYGISTSKCVFYEVEKVGHPTNFSFPGLGPTGTLENNPLEGTMGRTIYNTTPQRFSNFSDLLFVNYITIVSI